MSEWQPINTAPQVDDEAYRIIGGWWSKEVPPEWQQEMMWWDGYEWTIAPQCQVPIHLIDKGNGIEISHCQPTHWMPLPQPPFGAVSTSLTSSTNKGPMMKTGTHDMDEGEKQELRRWAVEQAVKWPQMLIGGSMNSAGSWTSGPGPSYADADVIGRAEKLVAYVLRGFSS